MAEEREGHTYRNSCSSTGLLTVRTYTGGIFTADPFTDLSQVHGIRVAPALHPIVWTVPWWFIQSTMPVHIQRRSSGPICWPPETIISNTFTLLNVSEVFYLQSTNICLAHLGLFFSSILTDLKNLWKLFSFI